MRTAALAFALVALVACASSPKGKTATDVVVASPPAASKLAAPPPDDPTNDWRTFAPKPYEGGPFYEVISLNVTAPSVYGGVCGFSGVEGALFLNCGSLARVDGDKLDLSLPSPPGATRSVEGRYPDDLWAMADTGSFSDGYQPPSDSFRTSDRSWSHYEGGAWKVLPNAGGRRFDYVDKSSLFFALPPVTDPKAGERPKSCADYSCLRVLPRVITSGKTKPDFSALADKITWLHHHDDENELPDDFAFVVDPAGPVYVFMRAMELATKRKGFGVARWTPAGGATFDWLPGALASKKKLTFFDPRLTQGKVAIGVAGDARTWLSVEGRNIRTIAPPADTKEEPPPMKERWFAEGSEIKERTPDGTERTVAKFDDPRGPQVVALSDDDVWVFTTSAVYRTIRPVEVLYRTESTGPLHPFPKPVEDDEPCSHYFAIIDATSKRSAPWMRLNEWRILDGGALELEVFGQVVLGQVVSSRKEGEELLKATMDLGNRIMEGNPHWLACARPVNAKPFVAPPAPETPSP